MAKLKKYTESKKNLFSTHKKNYMHGPNVHKTPNLLFLTHWYGFQVQGRGQYALIRKIYEIIENLKFSLLPCIFEKENA